MDENCINMSDGKKQATWGGRFSEGPAELMLRIGESVSFDQRLAPFDIQGSKAQAAMLAHVGILTIEERDAILSGLDAILSQIKAGEFSWDPALEDVHMNIEQALSLEVPAAAKLHTARSRNDQVATDMRLWFKSACDELDLTLAKVIAALVDMADQTQEVIIPGYTHLQRAQPIPMAHHLLAYVEMFARDLKLITAVKEQANVCPLGSGAIAGTTLQIDRDFVAKSLVLLMMRASQGSRKIAWMRSVIAILLSNSPQHVRLSVFISRDFQRISFCGVAQSLATLSFRMLSQQARV